MREKKKDEEEKEEEKKRREHEPSFVSFRSTSRKRNDPS